MSGPIDSLTIRGFLSIRNLERLKLGPLNVLIGANGAGKSNFITFFRMLNELVEGRLQVWLIKRGGSSIVLTRGLKETKRLEADIEFGSLGYSFTLEPTTTEGFVFVSEEAIHNTNEETEWYFFESGHKEAFSHQTETQRSQFPQYQLLHNRRVYHFQDTGDTAYVKRSGALHDNEYLRPDARNLAAFLYKLRHTHPDYYARIRSTVQQVAPFFDDFVLDPERLPSDEQMITLFWRQKHNDYPFHPSQLSDGTLRFICLATALLQPEPPPTILIDEPELGLHPYALAVLGALIRSASRHTQVIIATQSVPLLNEFSVDDLIVVEQEEGASVFKRLNEEDFALWLEDFSIGELWQQNVLGGRP